jgi:hypothetical protein
VFDDDPRGELDEEEFVSAMELTGARGGGPWAPRWCRTELSGGWADR